MTTEEQLALLHIGIIMKHFLPKEHLPDDLNDVAQLIYTHLNVKISGADSIPEVRDKVLEGYLKLAGGIGTPTKDPLADFDRAMKGI